MHRKTTTRGSYETMLYDKRPSKNDFTADGKNDMITATCEKDQGHGVTDE